MRLKILDEIVMNCCGMAKWVETYLNSLDCFIFYCASCDLHVGYIVDCGVVMLIWCTDSQMNKKTTYVLYDGVYWPIMDTGV